MYKIYFPLFDHIESSSNEMRLTQEGLLEHPRVHLVENPEEADYLIFCQNHLVDHCPFHKRFEPVKNRYKERSILLDYDDNPRRIFDAEDFRWRLYFKRSCVDRDHGRVMDYSGFAVLPTAYCLVNDMADFPDGYDNRRKIDVSCLFDDSVIDSPWFRKARGRLLTFARQLSITHGFNMQIGAVSETGPVGRSGIDPRYKQCLYHSKIVLHANPDPWEGDARTWEALGSGALVFVDRLRAPIKNPLIDGQHLIFYDLTDEGMNTLEQQIVHYLEADQEREKIGMQGRDFVMKHHRSINRVDEIFSELERSRVLQFGRSKKTAVEIDIIVTIATNYVNVDLYRQFISTLRRTGSTCPVFIGIHDGPEYEHVKKYLLENAVNYFFVPPITPGSRVQNGYRFDQYRQWLDGIEFRYALMLDFRDVYFQRDPFTDVEDFMHDCDLYLMSEFKFLTVGNHPNGVNYHWIKEAFGEPAADAIADEVILNCGAILGRKTAVMRFLTDYSQVARDQDFQYVDQGIFNHMVHTGLLDHCGRIKIERAGRSIVNNCGFTELDRLRQIRPITAEEEASIEFIPRDTRGRLKLYRNDEGWVLNDDGRVSHVVHQYDRYMPEIGSFVSRLSNHQYPDSVCVYRGGRAYNGEKFVLFSQKPLKPTALKLLTGKIRSLSVERKPLLLVDQTFRHGFVFAYGILCNELLFESETFRQEFAEETENRDKCEAFCKKWGYQPVYVDENEIFLSPPVWVKPTIHSPM